MKLAEIKTEIGKRIDFARASRQQLQSEYNERMEHDAKRDARYFPSHAILAARAIWACEQVGHMEAADAKQMELTNVIILLEKLEQ